MASTAQTQRRTVLVSDVIGNAKFNSYFLTIIIVCILSAMFDGYDSAIFGVATPMLIKSLKITPSQVGILASWGMVGMLGGSFLFGILGDALGRKKGLILCTLIFCTFTALCGLSTNFTEFSIFRFIAGVGLAGFAPTEGALISEFSPKKIRSSIITIGSWGITLGSIVVSFMGIIFVTKFGWRLLFYTSFALLILIIPQALCLPETMHKLVRQGKKKTIASILRKADPTFVPSEDDDYQLAKSDRGKASVWSLFVPGFGSNTLLYFGLLFCNYFMIFGLTMWLPKLMMQVGSSYTLALWFNIIFFAGSIFGIPISSAIAYKVPLKKVISVAYLLCAICVALLWVKVSVYLTVVLLLVGGGALQSAQGLMSSYVSQNYPLSIRSTAYGTIWMVGRIGSIVSPILLGALLTAGVKIQIDFGIVALPCIVGIVLIAFTRDYTKKGYPQLVTQPVAEAATAKS